MQLHTCCVCVQRLQPTNQPTNLSICISSDSTTCPQHTGAACPLQPPTVSRAVTRTVGQSEPCSRGPVLCLTQLCGATRGNSTNNNQHAPGASSNAEHRNSDRSNAGGRGRGSGHSSSSTATSAAARRTGTAGWRWWCGVGAWRQW